MFYPRESRLFFKKNTGKLPETSLSGLIVSYVSKLQSKIDNWKCNVIYQDILSINKRYLFLKRDVEILEGCLFIKIYFISFE